MRGGPRRQGHYTTAPGVKGVGSWWQGLSREALAGEGVLQLAWGQQVANRSFPTIPGGKKTGNSTKKPRRSRVRSGGAGTEKRPLRWVEGNLPALSCQLDFPKKIARF